MQQALYISDRLEGHVEELRGMKAEKGISIPDSVIEKAASMVDQVKDLQQKIDEANNNICRLKYQFIGKTKQTEDSNKKDSKEEIDTHHSQEAQNQK
jgi:TolA-binding protein